MWRKAQRRTTAGWDELDLPGFCPLGFGPFINVMEFSGFSGRRVTVFCLLLLCLGWIFKTSS